MGISLCIITDPNTALEIMQGGTEGCPHSQEEAVPCRLLIQKQ